jgi:hypothetical protein
MGVVAPPVRCLITVYSKLSFVLEGCQMQGTSSVDSINAGCVWGQSATVFVTSCLNAAAASLATIFHPCTASLALGLK